MKYMRRVSVFVLAMFSLGLFADQARAWNSPPPATPSVWIIPHGLHPDGSQWVWIIFHGYSTFGSDPGQFCVCALNQTEVIAAVEGVEVIDRRTLEPMEGFAFVSNSNSDFGGGTPWSGFSSDVSVRIPAGISVDIRFNVSLVPDATIAELITELENAGNVVGTDEANSDGSPTGFHQAIFTAGAVTTGIVPTLSEWTAIGMLLLLLTAGTIVFFRKRGREAAVA